MNIRTSLAALALCLASTAAMAATAPVAATTPAKSTIAAPAKAKIAKHAHERGMTLKEAGLDLGLVDEATFDRVVRPEDMVGR